MKRITIYQHDSGKDKQTLEASIDETGDLEMEGYDIGDSVEQYWGDSDYEYWVRVKAEHVSDVLLHLIKEHFDNSSKFMSWLKEKGIPYEFSNWI